MMHVLFVHKNYPAQFGHIAAYLARRHGMRCTFVSERPAGADNGVQRIQYKVPSGATARTHFCSRTFENFTWHSHAVYETLKAHPEIRPDLIVGHSGFGSTLFLRDLYDCPIINYFEWFYWSKGSDSDFRAEFPPHRLSGLRARSRNATLLADLHNCDAGYCPTHWQRSRLPAEYQYKLQTIFDGIDTSFWRPLRIARDTNLKIAGQAIPANKKIVTYVSRGFESMRGFDIFIRAANRICDRRDDVVFLCVGSDRICYGGDERYTKGKSFREHVLAEHPIDPDRFLFAGSVPPAELVKVFGISDAHIYLTVPFILSWSMLDAMACGCALVASDTEPVREMIRHGENGLLAPFYDVEALADQVCHALDDAELNRGVREAAEATIREQYSLDLVLPKMLALYEEVRRGTGGTIDSALIRTPPTTKPTTTELKWPAERPAYAATNGYVALSAAQRSLLQLARREQPRTIVEIGAWTGLRTRALAEHAPHAQIIAVDQWSRETGGLVTNWKAPLAQVRDAFVSNCWDVRGRVTPLAGSVQDALRRLQHSGEAPDLIVFRTEHTPTLETEIRLAVDTFPMAAIVGDNWHWPRLQATLTRIVEAGEREIAVADNYWAVWHRGKSRQR